MTEGPSYPEDATDRERASWANQFANLALFENVAPETMTTMFGASAFRRLDPGTLVFHADEEARFVFTMLEGIARGFQQNSRGLQYTSKVFRAPSHFGDLAALGGLDTYRSSIAAVTPMVVVATPLPVLELLLAKDHALCRAWLYSVARQHSVTIDFARQHTFGNLSTRLANTLLSFAEAFGVQGDRLCTINHRLSYAELAHHTASTRRATITAMQELASRGMVVGTSDGWRVDTERLAQELLPGRLSLGHTLEHNKNPDKKDEP